jgi:hypothetical protein
MSVRQHSPLTLTSDAALFPPTRPHSTPRRFDRPFATLTYLSVSVRSSRSREGTDPETRGQSGTREHVEATR